MCDQEKALRAMKAACADATRLKVFNTPEAIVGNDDHDIDDFVRAVEAASVKHFGAEIDFEAELIERGVGSLESPVVRDLNDRHHDIVLAMQLSAFALGVAWGRLETGAVRATFAS